MATYEECGAKASGRIHADAGDVNSEDVDDDQGYADGEACEASGRGFLGRSKDHDDEDKGGDELEDDRGSDIVFTLVAGTPTVLSQAADADVVAAGNAADDVEG